MFPLKIRTNIVSNQFLIYKINAMFVYLELTGLLAMAKGWLCDVEFWPQKSVLRRDIVTDDCWFHISSKICEYLSTRCDSAMSTSILMQGKLMKSDQITKALKQKELWLRIFLYTYSIQKEYKTEYLCKCEECINLNFLSCLEKSKGVKEVPMLVNAEAEVENNCE